MWTIRLTLDAPTTLRAVRATVRAHPRAVGAFGPDETRHTDTSNRVNSSCRYRCAHAERRILPLVVIGMEPGDTTTRSATCRLCDLEIADMTSRLTLCNLSRASSSEP